MIEYQAFADLCQSSDCDERGHAAHLAARAYLTHTGPADEHAALYAVLINFLDDSSVKVRAALAYGLLHSAEAPRPIIISLLHDSPIIARAVLQYSPILVDADLAPLTRSEDLPTLVAIAQRKPLSPRIAAMLIAQGKQELTLGILQRDDIALPAEMLVSLATTHGEDAKLRGAMLARNDLPASARLLLVRRVSESLRACRLVKGAITSGKLDKLLRDGTDKAVSVIGETVPADENFAAELVKTGQINTRLLLHSMVSGRVMFFSHCIGALAGVGQGKVFTLLADGNRASLNALLTRTGLDQTICRLLARLVILARTTDVSDDLAARHYVVTALTEEMLAEFDGIIPTELEEAFAYLSEQNVVLARSAARGVMSAFVQSPSGALQLRCGTDDRLALPAA